eukprot:CAMPEP_0118668294 /NCGR_PEP_ID=MMETSP0785-20121206/20265_1 /TAXON_ID=91992 /ORGANISM="Bolidomonas pacifica, Strain CCMP 1866" /LENGTH=114 /DNA_ID=CAMNT_0006562849 /DNA_START=223 /DNA_END=564 /DNA_ORIENTATION=+
MTVQPNREKKKRISRRKLSITVEATEETTLRLKKIGQNKTRIEFVTRLDLGENVSKGATKLALQRHLDETANVQRYFNNLVKTEDMTNEVGEALGVDMVWYGGQLGRQESRKDR